MKNITKYIFEQIISEGSKEKPFDTNDVKVSYGDIKSVIKLIKDDDTEWSWKKSANELIIDLPGNFNKEAWSGRSKPRLTYGLDILKKNDCEWKNITADDILHIAAIYYNHYEGYYSYWYNGSDWDKRDKMLPEGSELKDTKNIPVKVN